MGQKRLSVVAVALSVVVSGSVALALDPLGAPKAGPAAGQFELGGDFLYGAVDLNFHTKYNSQALQNGVVQPNQTVSGRQSTKVRNRSTNKLCANLGYGILENWEAFLRLGGADNGIAAGTLFAAGGGTKVTFYEAGKWSFGGVLQASWVRSDERTGSSLSPTSYSDGSTYDSLTEIQGTLGACYQLNPHVTLYGGPLAALTRGASVSKSTHVSGTYAQIARSSADIDETSWFGGYLGVQAEIHANVLANIEYQHTGGADAVAVGLVYRFGLSQ